MYPFKGPQGPILGPNLAMYCSFALISGKSQEKIHLGQLLELVEMKIMIEPFGPIRDENIWTHLSGSIYAPYDLYLKVDETVDLLGQLFISSWST